MDKRTIEDQELFGKKVFIRVDFNVPLTEEGHIREDTRIVCALPTIRRVIEKGGRVILASHLGRPAGKPDPAYSLKPVALRLEQLLGQAVPLAPDCVGKEVEQMVDRLLPGEVLMLENVRFHEGETSNDPTLAAGFARLADIVVNDAFGTAHRAHASNVGVAQRVSSSLAGLLMAAEIDFFNRSVLHPTHPVAAILGGSKISTKMAVIERLIDKVDCLLIGGAMAFTFLKARGHAVGRSMIEEEMLDMARNTEIKAKERGVSLFLPRDVVVGQSLTTDTTRTVSIEQIPNDWMGLDIGPETVRLFGKQLQSAKTIIWNGPMGVFEKPLFAHGTIQIAQKVAQSSALSIVGGGDSDAAVRQAGVAEQISFISTGGGAFMELLEGRDLPGITSLTDR